MAKNITKINFNGDLFKRHLRFSRIANIPNCGEQRQTNAMPIKLYRIEINIL